ncbi:MAG: tail fiber domain-containing protein, partial [Parafilimonas sp.]
WKPIAGVSSNYWKKSGSSIYYNTGNVGIGLSNPAYKLDVKGDVNISSGSVFRINGARVLYDDAPNQNMFAGDNAGIVNTGYNNTGIGPLSLHKNTGGNYNTAVGANSLGANTTGASNAALGEKALTANTTGNYNAAFGSGAMYKNTTSANNVAVGYQSLYNNVNTGNNVAIGFQSLYKSGASENVAVGYQSMYNNTSASDNISIGFQAMYNNTSGTGNVAVGTQSLYSNTIAINNTAVGYQSQHSNTSGTANTSLGWASLDANAGGYNNTAIGNAAMEYNVSGAYNTAVGSTALLNNTGNSNTAVGEKTMQANTSGSSNTALGSGALQANNSGSSNTAIGFQSLFRNTTGFNNVALGYQAGNGNNIAFHNIYIGNQVAPLNDGNYNIFMGDLAGNSNTNGEFNVYIGYGAGKSFTGTDFNTCLGYDAGQSSTGGGNTFVGYYSDVSPSSPNVSNSGSFGYQAIATAANQIFMGNPVVSAIETFGSFLGISDGRYKKNIKTNVVGLDFINKLRPITYNLDVHGLNNKLGIKEDNVMKAASDIKAKKIVSGFVAQEVEKAAKDVNYDFGGVHDPENDGDFYALNYSAFVVPLVKAVQQLSAKNDSLVQANTSLQSQINEMKAAIQMLANKEGVDLSTVNSQQATISAQLSNASLAQNVPNPYNHTTSIAYNLPATFSTAQIIVTDNAGKVLKTIIISGQGKGVLNLDASSLAAGAYNYSLYVEGRMIDTKKMILTK